MDGLARKSEGKQVKEFPSSMPFCLGCHQKWHYITFRIGLLDLKNPIKENPHKSASALGFISLVSRCNQVNNQD